MMLLAIIMTAVIMEAFLCLAALFKEIIIKKRNKYG